MVPMCEVMKIEKKDALLKISIRVSCRTTFIGFHKKNEKGKEKVVFQGEGIQKWLCNFLIRGGMSIV